jgi:hypothetical protein
MPHSNQGSVPSPGRDALTGLPALALVVAQDGRGLLGAEPAGGGVGEIGALLLPPALPQVCDRRFRPFGIAVWDASFGSMGCIALLL